MFYTVSVARLQHNAGDKTAAAGRTQAAGLKDPRNRLLDAIYSLRLGINHSVYRSIVGKASS